MAEKTAEKTAETAIGAAATGPVPGWGWTETALALMVLVWGLNFPIAKASIAQFEPLAFNAVRFAIASVFVFLVLRARGLVALPAREDVRTVIALGLLGNVVYQVAFIIGLSRTQAGHAALMLATTPIMTAFLSMLLGHERPGPRTWGGAALSILGVALVSGTSLTLHGSDALVGDLILVGASAAWAGYTVGARPIVRKYGAIRTTAWTLWVGALGLALVGMPSLLRQDWAAPDARAWGGMVYSALFAIGLAYLIWYRGVQKIGNTRTAIFSNLTPVVALGAAVLLLDERPGLLALVGAVLTITGVMVVRTDPGSAG